MDPAVTGLPAQLARDPGPQAGLTPVHKRAAGEVHAMRRLASATPVGLIETSGGQEDVQSFAWEAAGKLRTALRHARAVTACELLADYQAAALSGRPPPAGSRVLLEWLAGIVDPIEGDRPFGEDIERLTGASWPPALPARRLAFLIAPARLSHWHLSVCRCACPGDQSPRRHGGGARVAARRRV